MPRGRSAWVAPKDVDDVKMELFRWQAENDSRMRIGPCGKTHADYPLNPEIEEQVSYEWKANQFGVWATCAACDLRLGNLPKKEHSGKYSMNQNPAVEEQALSNILRTGAPCDAKQVKAEIEMIDAERRTAQALKETGAENQKPSPLPGHRGRQGRRAGQRGHRRRSGRADRVQQQPRTT